MAVPKQLLDNRGKALLRHAIEIGDLGEGSPWNIAETIVLQGTASILQARDKLPVSAVQRRFMRLSVTRP